MKKYYLILALLLIFSACAPNQISRSIESSISGVANVKKVRVSNNQANVRDGLSTNSQVLQQVNKGVTFDVVNQIADCYAIRLPNNQIGFIPIEECDPLTIDSSTIFSTTSRTSSPGNQTTTGTTSTTGTGTNQTPVQPQNNTNAASLSSDEQQMVNLVNSARAQNNLPSLTVDTSLANVARAKAQDMIDNNYFDHNSPTYGSPFDMMKSFGIKFTAAGENLAGNQTVQAAHDSLMNSPGHRANILNPNYTHIGIGIRNGGNYGKMFTQMFIAK